MRLLALPAIVALALTACVGARVEDDADGDGWLVTEDCDDANPIVLGPRAWYLDADGDGYGAGTAIETCVPPAGSVAEAGDCDDANPAFHPAAEEICDGADDDCDGAVDDGLSFVTRYQDADGDGYGDAATGAPDCTGTVGVADGSDCDDADDTVHPDAVEWCDGVDQDCDALVDEDAVDTLTWYVDADGDGYGAATASLACEEPTGATSEDGDCDDLATDVHPGATEICGDGVDQDCDGLGVGCGLADGLSLKAADAILAGYAAEDEFGMSVTPLGDLNGDGWGDLAVGGSYAGTPSTGSVYVYYGPFSGSVPVTGASARFVGPEVDGMTGRAMSSLGDWDGDGHGDLVVGSPGLYDTQGAAYVFRADQTGSYDLDTTATATIAPSRVDWFLGWAVAGGDVNGDGLLDVAIGAPYTSAVIENEGRAYVILGGATGTTKSSDAELVITGASTYDYLGYSLAMGDADGDGLDDVLVGGSIDAVALFLGDASGSVSFASADAYLTGPGSSATGAAVGAGDLDADGYTDLLVGAPYHDAAGTNAGAAYVVSGGATPGNVMLESGADIRVLGHDASDNAGDGLALAGDVDGDGAADLLIGARHDITGGGRTGSAWLLLAPTSGTIDLATVDALLRGYAGVLDAGMIVGAAGDLDGDGLDDLFVSAPDDSANKTPGYVHLILGRSGAF